MPTKPSDRIAPMLAAIEGRAPLIAEHRNAFDRDRRLPDIVFKALGDAGLFRPWLPEGLRGPGLSPLEFKEIARTLGRLPDVAARSRSRRRSFRA